MSNLPPGVTDSMIPGNRPGDIWINRQFESMTVTSDRDGFYGSTPELAEIGPYPDIEELEGAIWDALEDMIFSPWD